MEIEIEKTWRKILNETFEQPYFSKLVSRVKQAYSTEDIWPKGNQLFAAFTICPFDKVKVVILGQDPYPTPGHAEGLCFSVPKTVKPLAKSLQNIFKELQTDIGKEIPTHGNLTHWAEQGVFLLNTVLSVQAHEANSHKNFGWETFTDYVISTLSKEKKGIVFLLWGAQAQKKETLIDQSKHTILKAPHPSPLSAYRGFYGCKHFSKTNELLTLQKQEPINW